MARVSRLLTLLALYHHGHRVGRYISLERTIEQTKESYYETLQLSSFGWHDGSHDIMPWFNYFLCDHSRRVPRVRGTRQAVTLQLSAVDSPPPSYSSCLASCCSASCNRLRRRSAWHGHRVSTSVRGGLARGYISARPATPVNQQLDRDLGKGATGREQGITFSTVFEPSRVRPFELLTPVLLRFTPL